LRVHPALAWPARACALLAGLLLTALAALTCVSVVGRATGLWVLVGDFELTALAAGASIALFMPWCQLQRGHLFVDFFTARAGSRLRHRLDQAGTLVLAAVLGLLAWRSGLGAWAAWQSRTGTMILDFPEWIAHAAIAPPLGLAAVIAGVQGLQREARG
jgi:TRAP-type C4-dicarboxylate transport system permease small subunit